MDDGRDVLLGQFILRHTPLEDIPMARVVFRPSVDQEGSGLGVSPPPRLDDKYDGAAHQPCYHRDQAIRSFGDLGVSHEVPRR